MKKTFVTLATVAALVAAAAPVATTLANGPFGTVDTTVDAKAAQISREYQIQLGKVELLQAEDARVWEELAAAQSSLVNAENAVVAGESQFVAAKEFADNLIQQAKQGSYAKPEEEATAALRQAEVDGSVFVKQAGDARDAAKANLVSEQNRVASIQESANASRAALTEAQAVLAGLAAKLNGTPAAPDAGAAAPAGNAPATNGAAPAGNGAAAPAGNGAAANGKAAAKTVAAAQTATGAKTLPKTSAAK
ncbi:TPA: hypothetical protein U2C55_000726 [Streptococcus suis]|nr:hypothetical protein [Streptococcus suis]